MKALTFLAYISDPIPCFSSSLMVIMYHSILFCFWNIIFDMFFHSQTELRVQILLLEWPSHGLNYSFFPHNFRQDDIYVQSNRSINIAELRPVVLLDVHGVPKIWSQFCLLRQRCYYNGRRIYFWVIFLSFISIHKFINNQYIHCSLTCYYKLPTLLS